MESILEKTIQSVQKSEIAYCKFISANDAGKTGGHQSGYYIGKSFLPYIFEEKIEKNKDYELFVTIKWQSDFETESRFKYYGSKNECHFTRFKKDFPYLTDDNLGDLLILCKKSKNYYEAFVLQTDDEIEDFFAAFNISPNETNGIIPKQFEQLAEDKLLQCFLMFVRSLEREFPSTIELASRARECYNNSYHINSEIIKKDIDKQLLKWLDAEFELFKVIENDRYGNIIKQPFKTVEDFIATANTILNRRKSRAGKSLEHHLSEIFKTCGIPFSAQAITESNKRPDFIFPSIDNYYDYTFDANKLIMLASKTTCKDRWRQIINEADRIKTKHLFTLQQGISKNQLQEMYEHNICLVVAESNRKNFPMEYRDKIWSLNTFVEFVSTKQQ